MLSQHAAGLLSLSARSGRFAASLHAASAQASVRPLSRQPSSVPVMLHSPAAEQPGSSKQPQATMPSRLQADDGSGLGPQPSDSPDLPPAKQDRQIAVLNQMLSGPRLEGLPDLLSWCAPLSCCWWAPRSRLGVTSMSDLRRLAGAHQRAAQPQDRPVLQLPAAP